jgi:serine/threonine-protein kinase HipA
MMKCLGCYSEVNAGYCLRCRKKLFDKVRVSTTLNFDAPKADNIAAFQEHSKRMSISGVQLKYSLRLQNGLLELADKNGQYILKPIPPSKQLVNVEAVPENEHLTMQIAEQVFGIRTAANALIYFKDGERAYITKRFDVTSSGQKLLQEDFAQLSDRTKATHGETFKYDGTYEEIGRLIKKFVAASMPALEKFFQLVVFNYVFSNGDAHLKNFSLYRNDNGEYELTPAYDLMSTVIHTPHESDTALDLYEGDVYSEYYSTYGHYGRDNFFELSKRLGLVLRRAERIIDEFGAKSEVVSFFVDRSFLPEDVKKLYKDNVHDKLTRLHV